MVWSKQYVSGATLWRATQQRATRTAAATWVAKGPRILVLQWPCAPCERTQSQYVAPGSAGEELATRRRASGADENCGRGCGPGRRLSLLTWTMYHSTSNKMAFTSARVQGQGLHGPC